MVGTPSATADGERRRLPARIVLGAIAELARYGMDKEFRNFDPAQARVIIVQSAPRLLPAFPEALAANAQRSLERLGVEVLLGSRVDDIDATGVQSMAPASRRERYCGPPESWLLPRRDG